MRHAAAMAIVGAFGLLVGSGGIASALPFVCNTTIKGEVIEGNVVVEAGCQLIETQVNGNVKVASGGTLQADHVTIQGDLTSSDAGEIFVRCCHIGGDVTLGNTNRGPSGLVLNDLEIMGDLIIRNGTAVLNLVNLTIHEDVIVRFTKTTDEDGPAGEIIFGHNTVYGFVYFADNKALGSTFNRIAVHNNTIHKILEVDNNIARGGAGVNLIQIFENTVLMNLEADDNQAKGPAKSVNQVDISGNVVTTLIACYRNTPDPTASHSGPNTGTAVKQGQCAKL
jgi:hypothetical protein